MPAFMQEAAKTKGHTALMETLIFILLYFVAGMAESLGMLPGMIAYLVSDTDGFSMLQTGDMDLKVIYRLMENQPEWMTIYMLFSEIMLIIVYLVYCRFMEGRKLRTMGFQGKDLLQMYGRGLLTGLVLFGGAYLLCVLTGSVRMEGLAGDMVPSYIVLYFVGYMIQGMAEEVICRGYLLVSLSRRYSVLYSAVFSSFLFMALHFANQGMTVISVVNLFLFGFFMALLFVESGNIWVVAAVHTMWNFLQGNLFGISVSGLAKQNSVFATTLHGSRTVINGGSFGLEGGLAVTAILVLGIYVVYRRLQKRDMLLGRQPEGGEAAGSNRNRTTEDGPVKLEAQETWIEDEQGRVFRRNPAEYTETPWRPVQREAGKKEPENFGNILSDQKGTVHTVFDAEYFSIREESEKE